MKFASQRLTKRQRFSKGRVALIVSRFNEEIGEGLLVGALEVLRESGYQTADYDIFRVPGAFEIPLTAKACALTDRYRGIICLGAVIRGETPHFEYISQAVAHGINEVSRETKIPLGFGVLTPNTLDQARERSSPDEFNKGKEVALAVLEMIEVLEKVNHG